MTILSDGSEASRKKAVVRVTGMSCSSCVAKIERHLGKMEGQVSLSPQGSLSTADCCLSASLPPSLPPSLPCRCPLCPSGSALGEG